MKCRVNLYRVVRQYHYRFSLLCCICLRHERFFCFIFIRRLHLVIYFTVLGIQQRGTVCHIKLSPLLLLIVSHLISSALYLVNDFKTYRHGVVLLNGTELVE